MERKPTPPRKAREPHRKTLDLMFWHENEPVGFHRFSDFTGQKDPEKVAAAVEDSLRAEGYTPRVPAAVLSPGVGAWDIPDGSAAVIDAQAVHT